MLLANSRPHVVRQYETSPDAARTVVADAVGRMTRGFLRTDHHTHELVGVWEGAPVTRG